MQPPLTSSPPTLLMQTWKTILSSEEYYILRQKGTEPAGSGKKVRADDRCCFLPTYVGPLPLHPPNQFPKEPGTFVCAGCGAPLYKSEFK